MVYNMLSYGTGTTIFGINNSSGEVFVKNAAILRSDRSFEYLVIILLMLRLTNNCNTNYMYIMAALYITLLL